MLNILWVTFPFFALIGAGYFAARRAWLPLLAIPGLNTFVLYFALPCMLYRFGARTPTAQLLDWPLIGLYVACQLIMVGFVVCITRGPRINWNDAGLGALVTVFPNTGFMGVPLLVALLGAKAAGPTIAMIVVDMVMTSSLCVALSRLDAPGGAKAALTSALRGMASNPMPWAIGVGALASLTGFALPAPVMGTVNLLADAASPVALFTIGAVLARSQMGAETAAATPWQDYVPLALIKLLVHPALVLLLGVSLRQLGLPLDGFALTVAVLVAALPSASNVSLLAEKFGANNGRIARIILVSTMLAFGTFSGVASLLT